MTECNYRNRKRRSLIESVGDRLAWTVAFSVFCSLLVLISDTAIGGEEEKEFDIEKSFVAEGFDKSVAFSNREVFYIQGIFVSSPKPDGFETDFNSYDKFSIRQKGKFIAACTFDLGRVNTQDRKQFKNEKAELVKMVNAGGYKELISQRTGNNEGLIGKSRILPELELIGKPEIVQNTDDSIIVATRFTAKRTFLDASVKKTTVTALHGYVYFRDRSLQFFAVAEHDEDDSPVDGEKIFITWINTFLEWNK